MPRNTIFLSQFSWWKAELHQENHFASWAWIDNGCLPKKKEPSAMLADGSWIFFGSAFLGLLHFPEVARIDKTLEVSFAMFLDGFLDLVMDTGVE